jgi:ABC-2 type transport system ATP-binding protein
VHGAADRARRPGAAVTLRTAAQCLVGAALAFVTAAVSGITVIGQGDSNVFRYTLTAIPPIAAFGVANATLVRRPN